MTKLIEPKYKYWIITFRIDAAHIVKVNSPEDVFINPNKTFEIHYEDLRYKYLNIEEEARRIAHERKAGIDPRILLNDKNTIDDILALPQMKGREHEREHLTNMLGAVRMSPDDIRQEKIAEYDEAQQKTEVELCKQAYAELEQKRNYIPKQVRNLTQGELAFGLSQSGYIIGKKGFLALNDALNALYHAWENIVNDADKVRMMRELEKLAFHEAQRRMSIFFEGIFK